MLIEQPTAWPTTYPAMKSVLDALIKTNRGARRPAVDVTSLQRVRRDLGQLDRGTYQACTRSPHGWNSFAAFRLVREVACVTPLGHPDAPAFFRLAADIAELNAAARAALARPTPED